ncbi:MAG: GNAT family N-acetyltransferase [Eubacteriales bacterium]|nr:GNAT family N-acetyltransferase [Eubacteriales bacterium]
MEINRYEIKTLEDLTPLKEAWALLEQGEEMTTFQTFAWHCLLIREWNGWKLHNLYSRCYIYIAYDNGTPLMILPIIEYKFSTKTKWFGSPKGIYLMGQGSYSDYMNAIYTSFRGNVFDAICDKLKEDFRGKKFCLNSVRSDSELAAYLSGKNIPYDICTVGVSVKMQNSVEEYQASLSRKTRANLRKALNRIERDGLDYQIEILGPIKDNELLSEMVNIHVKRILIKNTKHEGIMQILSSYVRKSYRKYRDLHNNIIAMSMADNDNSVVVLVRMNGKLAGYQYGVREKNCIRLLQTCFDETYKFYSPVFRGVYDFILKCYEDDNIEEIDFTRGDEDFKHRLGGVDLDLYEFTI